MLRPPGFSTTELGDIEVIAHEGRLHVFHLCLPNHEGIAHWVSDDGIDWQACPDALRTGAPGTFDDDQLWTMSVTRCGEAFVMLYTAGSSSPSCSRWATRASWSSSGGWGGALARVAALVFDAGLSWPLYKAFPTIIGCAFVGAVGTSMFTPRASQEVLVRFWEQINPWGMWSAIAREGRIHCSLSEEDLQARQWERMIDAVALFFSIAFQFSILLAAMSFVFHDWTKFGFFASTSVVSAVGLYFLWYRNLKSTKQCLEEDARYENASDQAQCWVMLGRRATG